MVVRQPVACHCGSKIKDTTDFRLLNFQKTANNRLTGPISEEVGDLTLLKTLTLCK